MGGKFEQTKPPKPKVPKAPRKATDPKLPGNEAGNREQRRAAARKKAR